MAEYHFSNFVFEGGGVKGIAYVGALDELKKREILPKIKRVGGTSAGAINAVLLGLNFTPDEVKDILWRINFRNFMDDSFGIIRDTDRLLTEFGWYKGDYFRNWIGELIREKTGNTEATFADVSVLKSKKGFRDIYLIGTNLSTRFSEIFSIEHTPRMCIADAVRISMSIPLFFKAIRSARDDVYVDGGVLRNYPIKLFDREKYVSGKLARKTEYYERINKKIAKLERPISKYVFNKQTLGFRLDTREEISMFRDHAEPKHHEINDLFDYILNLVITMKDAQENSHLHSDDWQRTIYIDTLGVKTTDFDIDDEKKHALIESGRKGVREYFKWYDGVKRAVNK